MTISIKAKLNKLNTKQKSTNMEILDRLHAKSSQELLFSKKMSVGKQYYVKQKKKISFLDSVGVCNFEQFVHIKESKIDSLQGFSQLPLLTRSLYNKRISIKCKKICLFMFNFFSLYAQNLDHFCWIKTGYEPY